MKISFVGWRLCISQLYIILAFLLLGALAVYLMIDYDFAAIEEYIRWRMDSKMILLSVAWLLAAVFLILLGVRHLVEFVRERDDFIHSAMHDLKTPVAGLNLLIGRNDEAAKCVLERMRRMVDNFNTFLNDGHLPAPRKERFDLVEAFHEAYMLLAGDFEDADSGPVEVSGADERLEVFADRMQVTQILWNLLGNELKYAAPYGKVRVRFEKHTDDGAAVVKISDEGPGMSYIARKRAFSRYFRARAASKSGKGGFGIGLCAAREFARMNNGDLVLSPNRPHGCVFELIFDIMRDD